MHEGDDFLYRTGSLLTLGQLGGPLVIGQILFHKCCTCRRPMAFHLALSWTSHLASPPLITFIWLLSTMSCQMSAQIVTPMAFLRVLSWTSHLPLITFIWLFSTVFCQMSAQIVTPMAFHRVFSWISDLVHPPWSQQCIFWRLPTSGLDQSPKNLVGASALPTGKFLRVRKVFAPMYKITHKTFS